MSIELPPYRPIKRRNGLQVMFAAIHALIIRELQTRFGNYRLSYLWALIEPGLQVLLYLIVFGQIMGRALNGIEYSLFLVIGMLPWYMFQKHSIRAMGAIEANQGLLLHRPVLPIDTIIARFLLEFIIYGAAFVFTMLLLAGFGFNLSLAHLDLVIFCWLTLGAFALGFSLVVLVFSHYFKELSKLLPIVFTLMYFGSGVIYSINIVPEPYHSYLLINPIIHNLETIRHSLVPTYPIQKISMTYFLISMCVIVFLGLLLYRYAEKDLVRTK